MTPRFTVNLGLRYELISVVKERDGLEGNFDPNSATGVVQVGFQTSTPYNGDHNNFSPRLGLVWDVRGNGKTVIRAGGSLMYEYLPISTFSDIANALGLSLEPTGATKVFCSTVACGAGSTQIVQAGVGTSAVTQVVVAGTNGLNAGWQAQTAACLFTTNCGPVIPSSVVAATCGDGKTPSVVSALYPKDPPPCNIMAADRNLRTPYVSTWTINLQQAITNNLSVQAAYVGTHGTKLIGFQDINQPALSAAFSQSARPYYSKFPTPARRSFSSLCSVACCFSFQFPICRFVHLPVHVRRGEKVPTCLLECGRKAWRLAAPRRPRCSGGKDAELKVGRGGWGKQRAESGSRESGKAAL